MTFVSGQLCLNSSGVPAKFKKIFKLEWMNGC